jgi:tetratricopeptide (TPR) repeat protein
MNDDHRTIRHLHSPASPKPCQLLSPSACRLARLGGVTSTLQRVLLLGGFLLATSLLSPCQGADDPEDSAEYRAVKEAFEKRDFAEALKLAEALRDKYPESSVGWRCVGFAMGYQGKPKEAIKSYRRAIELDPENAEAHVLLGAALAELGKMEESIELLRRASELEPANTDYHDALGEVFALQIDTLASLGALDEVIATYRRAIELELRDYGVRDSFVGALRLLGRTDAAEWVKGKPRKVTGLDGQVVLVERLKPPTVIGEVIVERLGLVKESTEEILSAMATKVGDELSAEKLEEDTTTLYEKGVAETVKFFAEAMSRDAVRLIVQLRGPWYLGGVEIEGAKAISIEDIAAATALELGGPLDEAAIQKGGASIRELYQQEGFADVAVSHRITDPDEDGVSTVVYAVQESGGFLLGTIEFVGNGAFSNRSLAKQMELPSLMGKDQRVLTAGIEADADRIERHYQDNGYLLARVENLSKLRVDADTFDLFITISEGEQYTVSAVELTGDDQLPLDEITPKLRLKAGEVYSGADFEHDFGLIKDELTARGRAGARVRPELMSTGLNEVGVHYHVELAE